eukprot:COSAG04_NODE_2955_length_3350_cov_2.909566_2_plen_165_part_00
MPRVILNVSKTQITLHSRALAGTAASSNSTPATGSRCCAPSVSPRSSAYLEHRTTFVSPTDLIICDRRLTRTGRGCRQNARRRLLSPLHSLLVAPTDPSARPQAGQRTLCPCLIAAARRFRRLVFRSCAQLHQCVGPTMRMIVGSAVSHFLKWRCEWSESERNL